MEVGARIKELRQRKGWTQKELAEKVLKAQNTISQIETGIMVPDIKDIEQFCGVFGVTLDEFMKPGFGVVKENQTKFETKKEDSFAIMLIRRLLKEKIIKDPDNIDQTTIDMIIAALKADIKRIQEEDK